MADMTKPTLAILGGGIFARSDYVPALRHLTDVITLRAIWSRSEESATEAAAQARDFAPDVLVRWGNDGLNDILEDESIHAVSIVLAAEIQLDFVVKALHAGKHVIQEKPVGTCVSKVQDAFSEYKTICANRGKPLLWAVAENFRFEPPINEAALMVKEIGEFTVFEVIAHEPMNKENMYYGSVTTSWRKDFKGGLPLDGGVHFVATLRMITGLDVKSVAAISRHVDQNLAPPDTVATILQMEGGCTGVFMMSFHGANREEVVWRVLGTKGEVMVERVWQDGKKGYKASLIPGGKDKELKSISSPVSGVKGALQAFAADIVGVAFQGKDLSSADPRHSVQEALTDVAVIEAIFRSSASQGFTQLEKIDLS